MTTEIINKTDIEKRIDEWIKRLNCLFDQIDLWIKSLSNYEGKKSKAFQIQEELMVRFNVKPKEVPCYTIFFQGQKCAIFIPNALWIIGADGRINLTVNEKQYILLDLRSNRTGPSKWNLVTPNIRHIHMPFNKNTLLGLIKKR
jgi:hypothetical protein